MPQYLKIDGLKTSLRIVDTGDEVIDKSVDDRLASCLGAAEIYVQHSVGEDVTDFFNDDGVKELYEIAAYALATTYYQNPATITTGQQTNVDPVMNSIIGQLRGDYALRKDSVADDGSINQPSTFG
ncbi:head-tail connector protein [Lapidilactobacillus wuchangensis]|uniref:head-tail connector protein n=1 Tax=Lapidilactobacillus wuchangensis TaxID=2486001 RepID=UPI000F7962A9|nr:head-tail connector protein [Lapidilactobacillus wuchangensis]